ncbi:MAG: hypothetical protein PHW10_00180 [Candidatus Peribacteraceae bacterium]|nr:hypothetical protein [Candidatus Peribacteraceae bacterium]
MAPDASTLLPRKPGPLKRLYLWVLHWAETPYGTPALAVLAFAESSFFPIPPDVLQIALSVSRPKRSFFYAAVAGVASVLGGVFGWVIGFVFWAAVGDFFMRVIPGLTPENMAYVGNLYNDNAFLAIVTAAFTPIPYKVFTISAGVFSVPLGILIAASVVGRFGRFLLLGTLIYFFGPGIKRFIDRYFEWVSIAFFALLVGGFLVIKYVL